MQLNLSILALPLAFALPAVAQAVDPATIDWRFGTAEIADGGVYRWQQADIEADQRHAEAALRHAIAAERIAAAAEKQADATRRLADALEAQSTIREATRGQLAGITEALGQLRLTAEFTLPNDVRDRLIDTMHAITRWLAPPVATDTEADDAP